MRKAKAVKDEVGLAVWVPPPPKVYRPELTDDERLDIIEALYYIAQYYRKQSVIRGNMGNVKDRDFFKGIDEARRALANKLSKVKPHG